jgi:hypothetical protein
VAYDVGRQAAPQWRSGRGAFHTHQLPVCEPCRGELGLECGLWLAGVQPCLSRARRKGLPGRVPPHRKRQCRLLTAFIAHMTRADGKGGVRRRRTWAGLGRMVKTKSTTSVTHRAALPSRGMRRLTIPSKFSGLACQARPDLPETQCLSTQAFDSSINHASSVMSTLPQGISKTVTVLLLCAYARRGLELELEHAVTHCAVGQLTSGIPR